MQYNSHVPHTITVGAHCHAPPRAGCRYPRQPTHGPRSHRHAPPSCPSPLAQATSSVMLKCTGLLNRTTLSSLSLPAFDSAAAATTRWKCKSQCGAAITTGRRFSTQGGSSPSNQVRMLLVGSPVSIIVNQDASWHSLLSSPNRYVLPGLRQRYPLHAPLPHLPFHHNHLSGRPTAQAH